MMKKIVLEILILLFLGACPGFAKDYYVSPDGNDSNNGLTIDTPFQTPQKAANLVDPGDTVYFLKGVYKNPPEKRNSHFAILDIKRSGTAAQHIRFVNYPGHRVKFLINSSAGISVYGNYSYIDISGFEIEGNSSGYTIADLYDGKILKKDFIKERGIELNGRGIGIGAEFLKNGKPDKNNPPHHITVRNNYIHHTTGSGLGIGGADYITFENNVVHSCAWLTWNGESGISFWGGCKVASNEPPLHKNFIIGNISCNNENKIPWESRFNPDRKISDGNGIIIDCINYEWDGYDFEYYGGGRTLIKDNICMNNGGSGIHSLASRNLDIVDNITYMNERTVTDKCADIYSFGGTSINVVNNIIYSRYKIRSGNNGMYFDRNKDVIYDFNIYFNITGADIAGKNDIFTTEPVFAGSPPDSESIIRMMESDDAVPDAVEKTQKEIREKFVLNKTAPFYKNRKAYVDFETWEKNERPQYKLYEDILMKINVFEAIYYLRKDSINAALAKKNIQMKQIIELKKQAVAAAGNNDSESAEKYLAEICGLLEINLTSEMDTAVKFINEKVLLILKRAESDPEFKNLGAEKGVDPKKLSAIFSQIKLSYTADNMAKTAQCLVDFYHAVKSQPDYKY